MAEGLIDEVIDRGAVTAQIDATKKDIQELIALIQSVKGKAIEITAADSISGVNKLGKELDSLTDKTKKQTQAVIDNNRAAKESATVTQQTILAIQKENQSLEENIASRRKMQNTLNSLKAEQKEDIALLKKGTIDRAEYNKRLTESTIKVEAYKQRIAGLNQDIKAQVKGQITATDSLNGLRNTLNQATKEYENLSAAQKKAPAGQSLKAIVVGLTAEVSAQEQELGKFQRNVGNYGGAIGKFAKSAFGALRTLANIIPGLGLSGLLLVIADQIGDIFSVFQKRATDAEKYAKRLSDVNVKATEQIAEQKLEIESLVEEIQNENTSNERKEQILKLVNEKYEANVGHLSNINELETKFVAAAPAILAALEAKAKAQAAYGLAIEETKTELRLQLDLEKRQGQDGTGLDRFINRSLKKGLIETEKAKKDFLKIYKDTLIEANKIPKSLGAVGLDLGFDTQFGTKDKKGKTDHSAETAAKKRKDEADRLARELFKLREDELKNIIDFNKKVADNDEENLYVRLAALRRAKTAQEDLIIERAELEKILGTKTKAEIVAIEKGKLNDILFLNKTFEYERQQLKDEAAKKQLSIEIKLQEDLQKVIEDGYQKFLKREADRVKRTKDVADQRTEIIKQAAAQEREAYKDLYDELNETITEFFIAGDDRRIADLDKDIAAIEERRARDTEFIDQTVTNRQDAAAQIAIINDQAQSDTNRLLQKQKDIEREKANIERLSKIAEIAGTVASGILNLNIKAAEARATAAVLAANPLTLPFAGNARLQATLIEGQIPFVIAAGALQLAKLALPHFAEGGVHKGGLLVAGDGGRSEGLQLPDGTVLKTPATDTVYNAPAGTIIHRDYNEMMAKASVSGNPKFVSGGAKDNTGLIISELKTVTKTIKKIPQPVIKVQNLLSSRIRGNNYVNRQYS